MLLWLRNLHTRALFYTGLFLLAVTPLLISLLLQHYICEKKNIQTHKYKRCLLSVSIYGRFRLTGTTKQQSTVSVVYVKKKYQVDKTKQKKCNMSRAHPHHNGNNIDCAPTHRTLSLRSQTLTYIPQYPPPPTLSSTCSLPRHPVTPETFLFIQLM